MIRLVDAVTLAHTKLRTHKVRTGITIGIAGILFSVIVAGVIIVQGIFTSVENFSKEGLSSRSIMAVGRMNNPFNAYQNLENEKFIKDVEDEHARMVAVKTAAARKHIIPYNAATEDPSPISVNEENGKKFIDQSDTSKPAVIAVAKAYAQKRYKPFNIQGYLADYPSARILDNNSRVQPRDSASFDFMQDGKEKKLRDETNQLQGKDELVPSLIIMNQSIVEPFINSAVAFDPSKGEIPVIVPFDAAEKLLGLKKLSANAPTQTRYDRLNEVRKRIGEVTAVFCYRNTASQYLVQEAESQRRDFEKNGTKKGYVKPSVLYKPVSRTDCGAVEVESDSRTVIEKAYTNRYVEYQKEIGTYQGEPVQYKVLVRAVGVSKSAPVGGENGMVVDIGGMVEGLLGSWLGYEQWVIPPALLKQVPAQYRPEELFRIEEQKNVNQLQGMSAIALEEFIVEFDDVNEARLAMKRGETINYGSGEISAYPFGSSAVLMAEAKDMFMQIILWALVGVGGIATIILGSMIGRTVSEGRREGAVFRAIGARRSDIGGIYATYALLLSLRIVVFALVLGVAIALVVELLFSSQATLGARFAYASIETPKKFHFFGLNTVYLPIIANAIILVGLVASIIPIIRSARRNPIKDMRDDT